MEFAGVRAVQGICSAPRIQRRPPKRFARVDVADASDLVLVEEKVLVELKVAPEYCTADEAQLINELVSMGMKVGLLINFGRDRVEFKRLVH